MTVTLATGIREDLVLAANLDYGDPATVDLAALVADPETLVVPQAGAVHFRGAEPLTCRSRYVGVALPAVRSRLGSGQVGRAFEATRFLYQWALSFQVRVRVS
jgi:hypothetical protein